MNKAPSNDPGIDTLKDQRAVVLALQHALREHKPTGVSYSSLKKEEPGYWKRVVAYEEALIALHGQTRGSQYTRAKLLAEVKKATQSVPAQFYVEYLARIMNMERDLNLRISEKGATTFAYREMSTASDVI